MTYAIFSNVANRTSFEASGPYVETEAKTAVLFRSSGGNFRSTSMKAEQSGHESGPSSSAYVFLKL